MHTVEDHPLRSDRPQDLVGLMVDVHHHRSVHPCLVAHYVSIMMQTEKVVFHSKNGPVNIHRVHQTVLPTGAQSPDTVFMGQISKRKECPGVVVWG